MIGKFRRRHNRHFYLKDDLIQCSGTSNQQAFKGMRCHNWGKANHDGGTYWCHVHKVQALASLIQRESRE